MLLQNLGKTQQQQHAALFIRIDDNGNKINEKKKRFKAFSKFRPTKNQNEKRETIKRNETKKCTPISTCDIYCNSSNG